MKKLLLLGAILLIANFSDAQVNPHAIGLRLGGGPGFGGAEISYQHGLSEKNRLEFDAGFGASSNTSRFFLAGTYQWDWNLTGGLNWYVGPGAALGSYSSSGISGFYFGIGGQIGLEYDFNYLNAPILLSFDLRPMWGLTGGGTGFYSSAFGIRYTW